jgi:steroid delta-isomerase-like uncharacterized protein
MEPRAVIEAAIEAVLDHDLERIDGLLEPDFEFEDVPSGERRAGRAGMRELLADTWEVFPDYHLVNLVIHSGEDFLVLEAEVGGLHSATHLGVPASGKEVLFKACLVYEFGSEGRIRRERYYYDVDGLRGSLESAAG